MAADKEKVLDTAQKYADKAASLGAPVEVGETSPQDNEPHDSGNAFRWFQLVIWLFVLMCLASALLRK